MNWLEVQFSKHDKTLSRNVRSTNGSQIIKIGDITFNIKLKMLDFARQERLNFEISVVARR